MDGVLGVMICFVVIEVKRLDKMVEYIVKKKGEGKRLKIEFWDFLKFRSKVEKEDLKLAIDKE